MLDFLKKIFQKEELLQIEEVKLVDLEKWLEKQLRIQFQEETIEFLDKINEHEKILKNRLEVLENSQLNPKEEKQVEEKIKNIVIGHKQNYLQEIKNFLDRLEIPKQPELSTIISFNHFLNQQLDGLAKRTAKSYQAAQHLFFEPVEEIFKKLREINSVVKDFDKKLENKNYQKIKDLSKKVRLRDELSEKKDALIKELQSKENELSDCQKEEEEWKNKLVKLKESPGYVEFKQLKEKEIFLEKEIKNNRDKVFLFFSNIGKALRKYEKISLEQKWVKKYSDNAIEAFFQDEEMKIIGILINLKKNLKEGKLDLGEKQITAISKATKKIDEKYLEHIKIEDQKLIEKKKKLKTKILGCDIEEEIEKTKHKSEYFEERICIMQKEITELKTKSNSLDEKEIENELKKEIKEILSIELHWEKQKAFPVSKKFVY